MDFLKQFSTKESRYCLYAVLICIALARTLTLGAFPLTDKTEGRYAEIGRQMAVTNDWVTPKLAEGQPFWAKPPLSFWMTALSIKIFGPNEFGARFAAFVCGVISVLFVFLAGSILEGRIFGLLCAIILSTTGVFFVLSGSVLTDPSLCMTVTMAMSSFMIALHETRKLPKMLWGYLFFLSLGLGILAKGPISTVMIFFPLFVWCLVHKQFKKVFSDLPWIGGSLLMLIVSIPWHVMAEKASPGFLNYYIIGEHFKRFTVSGWKGDMYGSAHIQPRGMIWLFAIPATMPWLVLFIIILVKLFQKGGALKDLLKNKWVSYCFFWFLSAPIIFTASGNILITYMMPSLPAFAILTAYSLKSGAAAIRSTQIPWYLSQRGLFIFALFVPIVYFIGSYTFMTKIAKKSSQIELVEAFEKLSAGSGASLIYTRTMPYTGAFYANGLAKDITDKSSGKILEYLHDDKKDFFVINEEDFKLFPKKELSLICEEGKFGQYALYYECK